MSQIRNLILALMLSLAALLAPAGPAQALQPFPAECKLTLAASVPITFSRNHVLLPVTVNGKARVFAIDTGAFTSAVSDGVVAEQGIKTFGIRDGVEIGDLGHETAKLYATLDEFIIGNQRARDARMMVMKTEGVDGLVGPEYLRRFDLDFDFARQTLNLFRHHPCHDRAVYWTDDWFVVPMDVTDQGHIRVDVMLDGKPLRAMLDTGAAATIIGAPVAQSDFGVDMDHSNIEGAKMTPMSGANGGTLDALPWRFGGLRLSGINLKNPVLGVSTESFHSDYSSLLLGMDQLRKLHLYVAYDERKLYFSRANAGPDDPARTDH